MLTPPINAATLRNAQDRAMRGAHGAKAKRPTRKWDADRRAEKRAKLERQMRLAGAESSGAPHQPR